jgi:hypothetical protein
MRRSYYSPLTYSFTKLVLDGVLLRALPALLFAVPFYFLMGLNSGAGPFMTFALVFVAFNATVGALSLSLAAALNSPGKTVLAMNLVLLVGVLFSGFLANKESIPLPLRWITWLSVFRCGGGGGRGAAGGAAAFVRLAGRSVCQPHALRRHQAVALASPPPQPHPNLTPTLTLLHPTCHPGTRGRRW